MPKNRGKILENLRKPKDQKDLYEQSKINLDNTEMSKNDTKKCKPNQEHSIRSKKIHKTSQNLDKPFKFAENSHKIKTNLE